MTALETLGAVAAFILFILLVIAIGLLIGATAFAMFVVVICAAAVLIGTALLVFVALQITAFVTRLRLRRRDPYLHPFGDVACLDANRSAPAPRSPALRLDSTGLASPQAGLPAHNSQVRA